VIITDVLSGPDTSTPSGEPDDDFFSSWDKPAIKRPTPPISRTGTPGISRTASPFLKAENGDATSRPKSPLAGATDSGSESKPTAQRTTSNILRKGPTAGGARKGVLGAKKTQKLGAKKVTADVIDFDEAEKKAKEEADRIAKLGYDPDDEESVAKMKKETAASNVVSPSPISPPRASFGSTTSRDRSGSDVEKIGMGVGRLGFGQMGAAKAAAAPKKMGGFGSTGGSRSTEDGELFNSYVAYERN
jgi:ADP-ribosylation factor GTPase-activating protein 2/3